MSNTTDEIDVRVENKKSIMKNQANKILTIDQSKKGKRKRKRSNDDDKKHGSRLNDDDHIDEHPNHADKNGDRKQHVSLKNPPSLAEMNSSENDIVVNQRLTNHPNYRYILAPMVGASELPFRLLCRKYGTQLCYTPMMSSQSFSTVAEYRKDYFGTNHTEQVHYADHPIYAHVYANTVEEFVLAAQQAVAMNCDGIDLNLGCPQRTAYIGNYGSYLCTDNPQTHVHISKMLTAAVQEIHNKIPVTAKIRLLHATDVQVTLDLCRTLHNSNQGASLIAIHARERASWERTGPSARDGPANLLHVAKIVQHVHDDSKKNCNPIIKDNNNKTNEEQQQRLRIVTNGNTITYDDVVQNLQCTNADGIMSAEGLLDNPALYLPRYNNNNNNNKNDTTNMDKIQVTVWTLKEEYRYKYINYPTDDTTTNNNNNNNDHDDINVNIQLMQKKIRKIEVKLQSIQDQQQQQKEKSTSTVDKLQMKYDRYQTKEKKFQKKLQKLQATMGTKQHVQKSKSLNNGGSVDRPTDVINEDINPMMHDATEIDPHIERRTVTLQSLYDIASDRVLLGMEYLDWVTIYPTTIRTIVFHIRRMCKAELVQYQLLQPCIVATSIDTIRNLLNRIIHYRMHPETFVYDIQRGQEEKDALARQKYEEGKRKAYEERMIRKAKREKRDDVFYYLMIGAELPTPEQMEYYRTLDRDILIPIWKQHHSQHCVSYHMDTCQRGRACAFLHVDIATSSKQSLQEKEECAG